MIKKRGKIKFPIFSKTSLRFMTNMSTSFLLAIISILNLSKGSSEVQQSIRKGLPALDEWYYQKIYYSLKSFKDLHQPFVDSVQFSTRNIEILNFGDLFYRIVFRFLFPNDIFIAYLVSTIILVTLWIYFISTLLQSVGKTHFVVSAIITVTLIQLFFGNSRLPNNNYPFARIMSPQFVGLIWVVTLLLILKTINDERHLVENRALLFLSFSGLVFFASFTYLYLLLSILGTLLILILNFLRSQSFAKAIILAVASLIGSTPYLLSHLQKMDETKFIEAGQRMGLVESRAPGGGLTIVLCVSCLLVLKIIKATKFNIQDSIRNALSFSSLGVLIASQSNLVTNISIQFSYHFEIFAFINCIIILSIFLKKLLDKFRFTNSPIGQNLCLIGAIFIFLPIMYAISSEFKSTRNDLTTIQKRIEINFGAKSNLIVDVEGLQNTVRIYSTSRVLYQEDLIPYGYSNIEVLERYFISSGCSDKLTNDLLKQPLAYFIEASKQKGVSLQRYAKFFNLESQLNFLYEPLLEISMKRNELVDKQISDLRKKLQPDSCLNIARQNDVDFVVFDENSEWSEILDDKSIVKSDFGLEGIFYAQI